MNYLFIAQSELVSNKDHLTEGDLQAVLSGDRAKEALKDHDLKPGLKISCVVENTGRGKVEIVNCSPEKIELKARIEEALPARMPLDLVVAYSRPQTLKKLFHLASSLGLRSLSFVKTANVVPSYLQSKSLDQKEIYRHFLLGCEQAGDGIFPHLQQFASLHDFLKSDLVTSAKGQKLFGEASEKFEINAVGMATILFLGPESGFTEEEKSILLKYGFIAASLGSRVLRVEVAAAMLLGAVSKQNSI